MRTLPFAHWIANAAARFSSRHSAVTKQAQEELDASRAERDRLHAEVEDEGEF